MTLFVAPITVREANAFVEQYHRHHPPVRGHRFSLAAVDDSGRVRGVCVVGRPVSRGSGDHHDVAEVTRLATDGTRNACSFLYGAAARTCRAMGFLRLQTYTLPEEGGASLRAVGWHLEAMTKGGQWVHTDGKPRRQDLPQQPKWRWAVNLLTRPQFAIDFTPEETLLTEGETA